MKALTLRPEWAELVADGTKLVENRSWSCPVRGRIAVHRGGRGGAIIATVEVYDVVTPKEARRRLPKEQHRYVCGPLCWLLRKARRVKPVPCKGRLGLWDFKR